VIKIRTSIIPVCLITITWLFGGTVRALGQEANPTPTDTPIPLPVAILSPLPGQAVQGDFPIQANTSTPGYKNAELSFRYAGDPGQSWFLIAQIDTPVSNGKLADWDTSVLSDGNYTLQLSVTKEDGSREVAQVENIRVRNYTAVETDTPTPSLTPVPGKPPTQTLTPTTTTTSVFATPTPLPSNPIQLSTSDLLSGLLRGALGIFSLFAIFGLLALIRKSLRS
jgi:hypothetical protein